MGRIGTVVAREIKEAIPAIVFFLFLFHMMAYTRAVVLGGSGVEAMRAVGATVGAIIVAKAILVARALPMPGAASRHGLARILYKTFLFGFVVLLFKFLEELIHLGREHGGVAAATRAMFQEMSWPLFAVIALWIVGGLLLYNGIEELVGSVGHERTREIFLKKRS